MPDSRDKQLAREAERDAKGKEKGAESSATPDASKTQGDAPTRVSPATDLERMKFVVLIEFKPRGEVTLELEGAESLEGTWSVIESRPGGALIEITRTTGEQEKRRFEIEFESDNKTDGFRSRESGADPLFGRLYFAPTDQKPTAAVQRNGDGQDTNQDAKQ